MPRSARASAGGDGDHVIHRGDARSEVFHKPADYLAFLTIAAAAVIRLPMRVLAYGLLPNHVHLVLWPCEDGDLSRLMHGLMTSHVRRHLRHDHRSGHVWQGRFEAFPIQEDEHLLRVIRHVGRGQRPAGQPRRPGRGLALVGRASAPSPMARPWSPARSPGVPAGSNSSTRR
ncbi:transposase [Aquisphaera insulae]|uniref:transposase n=1 Tax=Aquisphaera insulae TaxID=2712864 RepID=UPI0013EDCFF1|nr:transposase [Aquisphaera insulae]